jgi:hypothetical protein
MSHGSGCVPAAVENNPRSGWIWDASHPWKVGSGDAAAPIAWALLSSWQDIDLLTVPGDLFLFEHAAPVCAGINNGMPAEDGAG